jgi:hypothetical protein
MNKTLSVRRIAASLLMAIFAAGTANAQNDNGHRNGQQRESQVDNNDRIHVDNGNRNGQLGREPVSVPEPGALGLFAAAAGALGLARLLRRRKR